MNHRQPEQLNNAQFPAESEPEYTLEEIMAAVSYTHLTLPTNRLV